MRISTIQAFNTGVRGIQDNYSSLTRTQEQISTGKRMLTPADDPVGSVRLLQLEQEAGKLTQYRENITIGLAPGGIAKAWVAGPCLEPIEIGRFEAHVSKVGPYEGTSGGKHRPLTETSKAYIEQFGVPYGSW